MKILRLTTLSILLALTMPFAARAQAAGTQTAEQAADRQRTQAFFTERTRLSTAAKQALAAEAAREKAGDCRAAAATASTLAAAMCLAREGKTTESNYNTLTQSIHALLALPSPYEDGPPAPGPSGTPLTTSEQVAEFDKLQKGWQQYEQTALSAAYDQFKGGTEAPVAEGEASQALLRSHMRELGSIYDFLLGNH